MSSGFLLIDKPAGITSHDVIDRLRRATGIRKIGHAGTLDPFATGLLLVAVERSATKHLDKLVGMDKTYEAEFILGATTPTLDPESAIVEDVQSVENVDANGIKAAMSQLTGNIEQIPPMHSAIKVGGKKLYELARKGQEIERKPRPVTIRDFSLLGEIRSEDGKLILPVHISCSSGTYVRALARDLAEALGTIGYCRALRRSSIGPFNVSTAATLDEINADNWSEWLKSPQEMGIDA